MQQYVPLVLASPSWMRLIASEFATVTISNPILFLVLPLTDSRHLDFLSFPNLIIGISPGFDRCNFVAGCYPDHSGFALLLFLLGRFGCMILALVSVSRQKCCYLDDAPE